MTQNIKQAVAISYSVLRKKGKKGEELKKALPKEIKKHYDKEMVMGMKAEKIHKVPVKVKDHLKEDKHYYTKLKKAGL